MNINQVLTKLRQSGYERRDGQVAMIDVANKTFDRSNISVVEGGTGIGKTFAYLIPAMLKQPDGLKIIISTATISLQEQLLTKDIRALEQILGVTINAKIAKGRRRYVCHSKLNQFHLYGNQGELFMFGVEENEAPSTDTKEHTKVQSLQNKLSHGTWNGQRDSLTEAIDDSLWSKLTVDASRCTNSKCSFFQQCAFFKAKKDLAFADIIITNHDLLLSDLRLGSGALLPPLDDSIYIIDEAHHLANKAVEHFSANTDLIGFTRVLETVEKTLKSAGQIARLDEVISEDIHFICTELKQQLVALFSFFEAHFSGYVKDNHWTLFELPHVLREHLTPMHNLALKLSHLVSTVKRKVAHAEEEALSAPLESIVSAWGFLEEKVKQFADALTMMLDTPLADQAPMARWISERTFGQGSQAKVVDYTLNATVTSAAKSLQEAFWHKRTHAILLCSATLRSLGKFDNFISQTGLLGIKGVTMHHFPSPFPYEKSHFIVPKMQHTPEGAMAKQYLQDVVAKLPSIVADDTAGTLVLFTSKWMLDSVYTQAPANLKTRILRQGAYSKHTLLKKHKTLIDKGKKSIIFGLESFAQGIDLPGKYCNHVVITKLPFSVPTTPIEKTRAKWLEQNGKNPFMLHALPEASMRLTQYVGRLIRSSSDVGKVTLLDRRIITKFYGKFLLKNLPAFTQLIE